MSNKPLKSSGRLPPPIHHIPVTSASLDIPIPPVHDSDLGVDIPIGHSQSPTPRPIGVGEDFEGSNDFDRDGGHEGDGFTSSHIPSMTEFVEQERMDLDRIGRDDGYEVGRVEGEIYDAGLPPPVARINLERQVIPGSGIGSGRRKRYGRVEIINPEGTLTKHDAGNLVTKDLLWGIMPNEWRAAEKEASHKALRRRIQELIKQKDIQIAWAAIERGKWTVKKTSWSEMKKSQAGIEVMREITEEFPYLKKYRDGWAAEEAFSKVTLSLTASMMAKLQRRNDKKTISEQTMRDIMGEFYTTTPPNGWKSDSHSHNDSRRKRDYESGSESFEDEGSYRKWNGPVQGTPQGYREDNRSGGLSFPPGNQREFQPHSTSRYTNGSPSVFSSSRSSRDLATTSSYRDLTKRSSTIGHTSRYLPEPFPTRSSLEVMERIGKPYIGSGSRRDQNGHQVEDQRALQKDPWKKVTNVTYEQTDKGVSVNEDLKTITSSKEQ